MAGMLHDVRKRRVVRLAVGALAAAFAAIALGACGSSSSNSSSGGSSSAGGSSSGGHTLTIGVSSDPQTIDPEYGQATRANELIKNIYAQWVHYAPKDSGSGYQVADLTKVVGEALQSFDQSPSGTVKMTVRSGVTLPSGKPLSADTFLYKVQRSLGLNAGSVFDFNILGLTSKSQVKKTSTNTFEFKLPHASPILGPMLRDQDASIVDQALMAKHASSSDPWAHKWLAQTGGAPTGAYTISQYVPGNKIVLKWNSHYWGPKPYFTTVVLQVIPTDQNRILLLENGSIDIAEDLSLDDAVQLKGKPGIKLISAPSLNQDMFGMLENKAPFNNQLVREAMAYAVPYQQLVSGALHGEASVATGVWPKNSIWNEHAPWPYSYNPAKAKALLAQAGVKNGLSFSVELSSADADASALAVPLQTALQAIGVHMNIKPVPASQLSTDLTAHSMQAWIQSGLGSYVDDPYYQMFLWYGSKSVLNWFAYKNPTVDAALKQFASPLSPGAKKALALNVQKQLNLDVPMISLGEANFLLPMRSNVGGFYYEPDNLLTYRYFNRS